VIHVDPQSRTVKQSQNGHWPVLNFRTFPSGQGKSKSPTMAISTSLTPTGLAALASIRPLTFQLMTAASSTAAASILDGSSNQVALSSVGQLLSALSSFRNTLEALQTSASDNSPSAVIETAQTLVDTFNTLQDRLRNLQTLFEALTDTSGSDPLAQSLNELAATSIAASSASLASLSSIGIDLQTAAASGTINQSVLNAAVTADSAGTQALLAEATQSLIDLTTGLETQIADTAISQTDLTTLLGNDLQEGVITPILPPDMTDTTNPDTAAENLLTTLLATGTTETATELTVTVTTTQNTATTLGATVTTTTPSVPNQTPTAVATAPVTSLLPATTTVAATAATTNPDLSASEAELALQRLLADPALHARNNLSDPAYAALIAASHLNDFVSTGQGVTPKAPAPDFPAPVSPVMQSHGIAYYGEATEEPKKRLAAYINNQI
jgi:hypothetical protein